MKDVFLTDPAWTGVNRLSIRALTYSGSHINPDGCLRAAKSNLARQLAESILDKSGHFTYSQKADQPALIQADAIVLTEDEYIALCARMYRSGFERGRMW